MAYVGSSWNSGDTTLAINSLDNQKDVDHTLLNDDNYRCIIFPSSNCKFEFRNATLQPSGKNSISSNTCTDSESEFDESVNVIPCLPTNFSNPCTNDDHIFKPGERALDAARVTFDQTLYICSNGSPELRLKKRSIRREVENTSARVARLTKKTNCFREKHNLKNKHCRMRFCTSRFPGKCEKQTALKDKIFLEEERTRSNGSVQSGMKGILQDTKKSCNFTNIVLEDERGACKRKTLIENRIAKNKRLLKTVKDVIHEMSEQENLLQMDLSSIQSIKPQNEATVTNLANRKKCEQEIRVIKPMKIGNNGAVTIDLQKPVFKKQKMGKLLDDSMHEAVTKYRTNRDTWDRIMKEQFIEA